MLLLSFYRIGYVVTSNIYGSCITVPDPDVSSVIVSIIRWH